MSKYVLNFRKWTRNRMAKLIANVSGIKSPYSIILPIDTFRLQLKYLEQRQEQVDIQIWFQMIIEITQPKIRLIASTRSTHTV